MPRNERGVGKRARVCHDAVKDAGARVAEGAADGRYNPGCPLR